MSWQHWFTTSEGIEAITYPMGFLGKTLPFSGIFEFKEEIKER
jgi:hypothetical protein